jgi:hypothetical protein
VPTHKVPTYRARFGTLGKGRVNMIVARLTSHKLSVFFRAWTFLLGVRKTRDLRRLYVAEFCGWGASIKEETNEQRNK